jgi:hypothetical protein
MLIAPWWRERFRLWTIYMKVIFGNFEKGSPPVFSWSGSVMKKMIWSDLILIWSDLIRDFGSDQIIKMIWSASDQIIFEKFGEIGLNLRKICTNFSDHFGIIFLIQSLDQIRSDHFKWSVPPDQIRSFLKIPDQENTVHNFQINMNKLLTKGRDSK